MEFFGTDRATGTGSHINEDLIMGDDSVEYLMPEIGAHLALASF